jgi:DNA-binding NarL/FixJ family response regulator
MAGRDLKILIAEGNSLLAETICDLFAEANPDGPLLTARSESEALDLAGRESPDLVLIDHRIGRPDVEWTVRRVLARSPHSWIVVVATNLDDRSRLRLRSAGAACCIEKEELVDSVDAILESARRR